MKRRTFLAMVPASLLAAPLAAEAQLPPKTARIGFLSLSSGATPTMEISPGLRELGWIEGQNITIEYRWAAGRVDQLPALATELVRLKVDIIVTSSTLAAQAAKRATSTIPIVVTFIADPVGSGLVAEGVTRAPSSQRRAMPAPESNKSDIGSLTRLSTTRVEITGALRLRSGRKRPRAAREDHFGNSWYQL